MKIAAIVIGAVLAVAVLTVVLYRSTRRDLPTPASISALPGDLEGYLRAREARFDDLRPGTEARIVWNDPTTRARTAVVVVYLHGFSATRQETAPLSEDVARALGANLYYARLQGHGRDGTALAEATVAGWLADVREARAIAARLGERTILLGTSTGGTLAIWAATQREWRDQLEALVLISPNLAPQDGKADLLLWPGGLTLARWLNGVERVWEPQNAEQAKFWTTRYPIEALATMMRLVEGVRRLDPATIDVPVLLLHSDHDTVIRVDAARDAFDRMASARKQRVVVDDVGDAEGHVLAGAILSPATTQRVADAIVGFVQPSAGAP